MNNPYAPPAVPIRDGSVRRLTFADALMFGVPALLYAAHGLLVLGIAVSVFVDPTAPRHPELLEAVRRPLNVMQPICTLFTSAMLLVRSRLAAVGACLFPVLVVAHSLYYGTDVSLRYLALIGSLALYVLLLVALRRLK